MVFGRGFLEGAPGPGAARDTGGLRACCLQPRNAGCSSEHEANAEVSSTGFICLTWNDLIRSISGSYLCEFSENFSSLFCFRFQIGRYRVIH